MKPVFHSCELKHANGSRLRIVAFRRECRDLTADFDCIWIQDRPGGIDCSEFSIDDFARGMGHDGLFAAILVRMASSVVDPVDEAGKPVPVPPATPESLRESAMGFLRTAHSLLVQAGDLQAGIATSDVDGLFETVRRTLGYTP